MPPNFDPIARPYRWLEYLTFGPYLELCRSHFVHSLRDRRRGLVLGDGDGRFTARLLSANREITVDAVDSSSAMLRLLTARAATLSGAARLRVWQGDAMASDFLENADDAQTFDLVATHFFLDCLSDSEVSVLTGRIRSHLAPGAVWLVSEFAIPDRQPAAFFARILIGALYCAFGWITGMRIRRLPDYASALRCIGLARGARKSYLCGILVAEVWSDAGASKATAGGKPDSQRER